MWVFAIRYFIPLTEYEQRFSQMEHEALSLAWAYKRLHPYIYGQKFDLIMDHKPLKTIYGQRSKPCACIKRWVLRLQLYDFCVVHIPGEQNITDPRSCLVCGKKGQQTHKHEAEECVRFVALNATPRALITRTVEEASADELKKVRQAIQTVILMNACHTPPLPMS